MVFSRPTAAPAVVPVLERGSRLRHPVFASVAGAVSLDPAPNTYRGSRPIASATWAGRQRLHVPEAHPFPRAGLLMTCDLEDPLSPGSGEGQSRERSSARAPDDFGEGAEARVQSSAAGCRATALTTVVHLALSGARGRCGLGELRPLVRLPLDGGLTALPLPQLTVARKRSPSNAFPRTSMK